MMIVLSFTKNMFSHKQREVLFEWSEIHKVFTFSQLTYLTCVQNNSSQGFE